MTGLTDNDESDIEGKEEVRPMPPLTNSEISESENEAEGERENIMENKEEDLTLKEKTEGKLTKESTC